MTPDEAKQYLHSFINLEDNLHHLSNQSFTLDRMHAIVRALGNPHQDLRIIHVAGSKGKGSTCVMIANILKEAGYKVGLYTSPHIVSIQERIRILSEQNQGDSHLIFRDCITDEQLAEIIESIRETVEELQSNESIGRITFYELYTAIAMLYFKKQDVDFVILETGLGGRLDATNVFESMIGVITPISLEHTNILGHTVQEIAVEKAAIIKNDQYVVMASQSEEAEDVIMDRCKTLNIDPIDVKKDVIIREQQNDLLHQSFNITTRHGNYPNLKVSLLGLHQAHNAGVAISVVELIKDKGFSIPVNAIFDGLEKLYWPIRFEIIQTQPIMILDAAHNEASMIEMVETFRSICREKKAVVVLGVSKDKNISAICSIVKDIAEVVYVTQSSHPRSYRFNDSELDYLFSGVPVKAIPTIEECVHVVKSEHSDDIVLFVGSVFLASEARQILINNQFVKV